MKCVAGWAIFGGIFVLVMALLWAGPYFRSRNGADVLPAGNPSVGTAGRARTSKVEESPATLHDLETVTGAVDPHELIGRRVDFHVTVVDINNDMSFWVGTKGNRLLVVLGRDNRSDAQRDHGASSPNDLNPAAPGQTVRITGTLEVIQGAEARVSWGLNDSQRRALKDQKVYIRADTMVPEE